MAELRPDPAPAVIPGTVKLAVVRRLGDDWRDLADALNIPAHTQRRLARGEEPERAVWEWLEDRAALGRLAGALASIGRTDLSILVSTGAAGLAPATVDFSSLIRERTEDFVGRRMLVQQISDAMDDPELGSGYLVIQGEPGIGKTALLATLVRRWSLVHHFNSVLTGVTSTERFLRNVCAQLILAYDLPYDRLPDDVAADSATLLKLLGEAARDRRVIVAVDAVDEAGANRTGTNSLLLPPTLPHGVFVLLTLRHPEGVPLYVDASRSVVIDERNPENLRDAREYVDVFLSRYRKVMADRLAVLGMEEASFAALVTERSEGNFMYLRHVLRAVRDQTLGGTERTALDELPHGLRAYYSHLENQLGVVHGAAPERQLKILAVLATWPEPLTVPRLAELSGEAPDTTRAVLRRWAAFLNQLEHTGEARYALYHASFRDFLAERLDMSDVRSQMGRAIKDAMP